MTTKKQSDFLGSFLEGARSPQVAGNAQGPHTAMDGETPVVPLDAHPRGPAQKGAFKRVHR